MEKERFSPCTVTIPPLKSCTTGTADSKPLWISLVEDDPLAGVLGEGTVSDNVSWVITEGTKTVWTVLLRMLAYLGRTPFFLLLGRAILTKRPTSSQ